jgi:septal ring factor EnvC (AmiA/AmiB activator)
MASKNKYINIEQMKRIDALSSTGQYTQEQIAERVGTSPATVSRVMQAIRGDRRDHIGQRLVDMATNYSHFEKGLKAQESDTHSLSAQIDIATKKLVSLAGAVSAFKDTFSEVNDAIEEINAKIEKLKKEV